ncbi:Similar to spopl: Speckle-type POZ protein-like (Xenopus laevis) [Cotesia congregata]|uniref:Similar to spopl: Speckle-type POZ protein-like (Xenopus laevis) n=1 Tax=Cotesia congregata TaxID=51543 RepID=A0A8J2HKT3_COTCN|nr:Similar to spopl: Speckle-type POZ protein-like (Xenopus laevis) [Cotesia congregata]
MMHRLHPSPNDIILNSSVFTTGSKSADKWGVILYFNNGTRSNYSPNVLTMFLKNLNEHDVKAQYSFFFLDQNQVKHPIIHSVQEFKTSQKSWGTHLNKTILLTNPYEMMPDDVLTLCIEVIVTDDKVTVPNVPFNSSKIQIIEDLKELYNNRESSDVTINIENKQIKAHKVILMARSPVLAAMFTHDMSEKKSNEVFITDISPDIFEKLLQYIYTDEVSDLDSIAADLLKAADKYQLQSLKKMCEESLCKNLKPDNLISMMNFAERHNAESMLKYVNECIALDAENITQSNEFKKLEKSSMGFGLFRTLLALNANKTNEIVYTS